MTRFVAPAELSSAQKTRAQKFFMAWRSGADGEMEANYLWLPHVSSEKCPEPGEGDPPQRVRIPSGSRPVPAARRKQEQEKPREAREDTSSGDGSEVTSWPLIPSSPGYLGQRGSTAESDVPSFSLSLESRF